MSLHVFALAENPFTCVCLSETVFHVFASAKHHPTQLTSQRTLKFLLPAANKGGRENLSKERENNNNNNNFPTAGRAGAISKPGTGQVAEGFGKEERVGQEGDRREEGVKGQPWSQGYS